VNRSFRAIDPEVRRIETYAGGQRDTFYWRDDRDRSCSIDHCGRHLRVTGSARDYNSKFCRLILNSYALCVGNRSFAILARLI
jgi:hypothetical protein